MTLLAERELTPQEREAVADEPRPGVWVTTKFDRKTDGRMFSQYETDILIGRELAMTFVDGPDSYALHDLIGVPPTVEVGCGRVAYRQRGGIHSDPLVRLLAFRAWGDRDRRWFTYGFDELVTWRDDRTRELVVRGRFHGEVRERRVPFSVLTTTPLEQLVVMRTIGDMGRELGIDHPNLPR